MPLYEFTCKDCKHDFESFLKVEERMKARCPQCGSKDTLRHCGNQGGFRLGTGGSVSWASGGYNTHYGDIKNSEEGRKVF